MFLGNPWQDNLRTIKWRERIRDQYYAEGKLLGKEQAAQQILVAIVEVRFPELTELARKQVERCEEVEGLQLLIMQILTAPDVTVIRWLLESMPDWVDCLPRKDRLGLPYSQC